MADKLIKNARALKGHTREAMIQASKYIVAFRKAVEDLGADAVSFVGAGQEL